MNTISAAMPTGHDPFEGVTERGVIVTGVRRDKVPAAFEPVIQDATTRVAAIPGNHSLYAYGSVATGMARVGRSDVDLMTIGLDPAMAHRIGRQLSTAYRGLCRGVEIGPAQPSDYEGIGDESYGNRVFLRHCCVHLSGPDLRLALPGHPADAAAARGFNGDIGRCADRWRTQLLRERDPAPSGRRIARKTLFAVAGLVSVHDATWTTDKVAAARRWGVVRPEWASSLQVLVHWSDPATTAPARAEVVVQLDGVVAAVVDDFRRRIGLWTP